MSTGALALRAVVVASIPAAALNGSLGCVYACPADGCFDTFEVTIRDELGDRVTQYSATLEVNDEPLSVECTGGRETFYIERPDLPDVTNSQVSLSCMTSSETLTVESSEHLPAETRLRIEAPEGTYDEPFAPTVTGTDSAGCSQLCDIGSLTATLD